MEDWELLAKCRLDENMTVSFFFHFPSGRGNITRHAAKVAKYCSDCTVKSECKAAGVNDAGFWGGELNPPKELRSQHRLKGTR